MPQPIWLLRLVVPFCFVLVRDPGAFAGITHYSGEKGAAAGFELRLFGAAFTAGVALGGALGLSLPGIKFERVRVRRPEHGASPWLSGRNLRAVLHA